MTVNPTRVWGSLLVWLTVAVSCRAYGGAAVGDDTFIYLQYARNALSGHGYTFNAGEASFGITSPVWLFVMTPIAAVSGNVLEVWRLTSVAFLASAATVAFVVVSRLGVSLPWAFGLALAAALEPHTFRWASSGMENGLSAFMLASIAGLCVAIRRGAKPSAPFWLGICTGMLPFVRPELTVLAVAIIWLYRRPPLLTAAAASFFMAAALTTWAFGGVIPQTAAAKAIALHQLDPFYGTRQALTVMLTGSGALGLLLALISRGASPGLAMATWASVATSVGYLGAVDQLVSTRYASYLSYPIVVSAVLVSAAVLPRRRALIAGLLTAHVAGSFAVLLYLFPATRSSETDDVRRFAEQVTAVTRPGARIALSEVGAFGFYADRYVVDLVGLVDPASLQWLDRHGKMTGLGQLEEILRDRAAEYFVDAFAGSEPISGIQFRFVPLNEGRVRRNILWGGVTHSDRWRLYRLEPRPLPHG